MRRRAWDHVIHDSPSLGYVVATHQTLRYRRRSQRLDVLSPFAGADPRASRELLLRRPWSEWRDAILADLARAHPDIRHVREPYRHHAHGARDATPDSGFLGAEWRRRLGNRGGRCSTANPTRRIVALRGSTVLGRPRRLARESLDG